MSRVPSAGRRGTRVHRLGAPPRRLWRVCSAGRATHGHRGEPRVRSQREPGRLPGGRRVGGPQSPDGRLTLAYDGDALLEYSNRLGRADLNRMIVVPVEGRTSFTAAEHELAGIRAALDESGFPALRPAYLPAMEGEDLTSYWITHCGKE